MMRAKPSSIAVHVGIIALLASCAATHSDLADSADSRAALPFLWSVDNGRAWIYGSIHVSKGEGTEIEQAALDLVDQADGLGVELDVQRPERQQGLLGLMMYGEGESLRDHLPAATYERVQQASGSVGIPPEWMNRFRPWAAGLLLSVAKLQQLGYSEEGGVDVALLSRVKAAGKPIYELESAEDQIRALAAGTPGEHVAQLEQLLDALDQTGPETEKLVAAYRRGDDEALLATSSAQLQPSLAAQLIGRRNVTMAAAIAELVERQQHVFVVVGVLHLVGPDSIIAQLRARGLDVERLPGQGMVTLPVTAPAPTSAGTCPVRHTIHIPGDPPLVEQSHTDGGQTKSTRVATTTDDGAFYIFSISEVPFIADAVTVSGLYAGGVNGFAESAGMQIVELRDVDVSGFPAREALLHKDSWVVHARFAFAEGRFYMAVVGAKDEGGAAARAAELFESFELRPEPGCHSEQ